MARLYKIAKAQDRSKRGKPQYTCTKCGKPIEIGTPYVKWDFRFGASHKRHDTPACRPTADELEGNSKRQAAIRASTAVDKAREAPDPQAAAEYLREAMSEVEGIIEELGSAIDGWDSTDFGSQNPMYDSFESTKSELEDWLSTHETIADDLDGFDIEPEAPGEEPDSETDREAWDEWSAANEAVEDYETELQSKIDEIEDVPELDLGG